MRPTPERTSLTTELFESLKKNALKKAEAGEAEVNRPIAQEFFNEASTDTFVALFEAWNEARTQQEEADGVLRSALQERPMTKHDKATLMKTLLLTVYAVPAHELVAPQNRRVLELNRIPIQEENRDAELAVITAFTQQVAALQTEHSESFIGSDNKNNVCAHFLYTLYAGDPRNRQACLELEQQAGEIGILLAAFRSVTEKHVLADTQKVIDAQRNEKLLVIPTPTFIYRELYAEALRSTATQTA